MGDIQLVWIIEWFRQMTVRLQLTYGILFPKKLEDKKQVGYIVSWLTVDQIIEVIQCVCVCFINTVDLVFNELL